MFEQGFAVFPPAGGLGIRHERAENAKPFNQCCACRRLSSAVACSHAHGRFGGALADGWRRRRTERRLRPLRAWQRWHRRSQRNRGHRGSSRKLPRSAPGHGLAQSLPISRSARRRRRVGQRGSIRDDRRRRHGRAGRLWLWRHERRAFVRLHSQSADWHAACCRGVRGRVSRGPRTM